MPRLFTGLEVPNDIATELNHLKGGIPGARWVDADAFHITLRFIGDVSDTIADELDRNLSTVHVDPFELQLKGTGYFGGNRPRALYMRIAAHKALDRLQATHERICQISGLAPEGRKFTPHVTLARFRNPPLDAVTEFVARHNLYVSRPLPITQFVLFSARSGRGGGPYVRERTYVFEP